MDITVGDIRLTLDFPPGVHPHSPTSVSFAERIEVGRDDEVLDLGCGAGLIGLVAGARGAKRVCAVDCDPAAVEAAIANAAGNRVARFSARVGDWFVPVRGEKFDVICGNPPQTPAATPIRPDKWGGSDGATHLCALIRAAPAFLRPGGRLYLMHISLANPSRVADVLGERFETKVLGESPRPFTFAEYDEISPGLSRHIAEQRRRRQADFSDAPNGGVFTVRYLKAVLRAD